MNEKTRLHRSPPELKSQLTRVTRLLRRAQDYLHNARGQSPTYRELEEWTQTPRATITDWFNNKGLPTAEFLLQVLERVPEEKREGMIDAVCRVWPSLGHRWMRCDQTVISLLKTIVCHPRGLVLVQGGDDEGRTFVVTALGNTFLDLTVKPRRVAGIDAHEPDWFVPLPGVRYLHNMVQQAKLLEAVRTYWPKVQPDRAQLTVLNGLEAVLHNFYKQVKALSAQSPVIITEAGQIKPALLKRYGAGPIHIVTLTKHPENSKGIMVVVEAI